MPLIGSMLTVPAAPLKSARSACVNAPWVPDASDAEFKLCALIFLAPVPPGEPVFQNCVVGPAPNGVKRRLSTDQRLTLVPLNQVNVNVGSAPLMVTSPTVTQVSPLPFLKAAVVPAKVSLPVVCVSAVVTMMSEDSCWPAVAKF